MTIILALAASIVGSAYVAVELGFERYSVIVLLAFAVLLGLFTANERAHKKQQKLEIEPARGAIDFFTQVGLAFYFAATWPSLPLIVWLGRVTRGEPAPPRAAS